jgi:hypothetical protein
VFLAICTAALAGLGVWQHFKIVRQQEEIAFLNKAAAEQASSAADAKGLPGRAQPSIAKQLLAAIKAGESERVTSILAEHPELLSARIGANASTALHAAAYAGRANVVNELLKMNADVSARNSMGWTPIYDAVASGKPEIVLMLLEKNADVNVRNKQGQTPLQFAVSKERPEIAELLRQHGARE